MRIPDNRIGEFQVRTENRRGGEVQVLYHNKEIYMIDDKKNTETQFEIIKHCSGKILIGGLGLGLAVDFLAGKKEVLEITVVEKYSEVIDLVSPYLKAQGKARLVCNEVGDYLKQTKELFDYVYIDISPECEYPQKYKNELAALRVLAEKAVTPRQSSRVIIWNENGEVG